MIELKLAHARKQMRAKRPDLAAKELSQAAEWDRPDTPDGLLCITRLLRQLADRYGLAILWVSHDRALLDAVADNVPRLP